jgi:uncharacterized protein YoxC
MGEITNDYTHLNQQCHTASKHTNIFLHLFQNLKADITSKEQHVNIVNEEANEMLNCAPSGSLQELARALMRLNALWTDVYNRVDPYRAFHSFSSGR